MAKQGGLVHILWGSQTGVSEEIAKQINERCKTKNIQSSLHSMQNYTEINFNESNILIIVVSSTGEGDPPDNALKFMRYLRTQKREFDKLEDNKKVLPLQNIKIAILGLGDTNYSSFQGNPRNLHQLMLSLGASDFHKRGEVDEVLGLEEQVEDWISGMWESLQSAIELQNIEISLKQLNLSPSSSSSSPSSSSQAGDNKSDDAKPKKKFVFKKKSTQENNNNNGSPSSSSSSSSNAGIKPASLPVNRLQNNLIFINEDELGCDYDSNLLPLRFSENSHRSKLVSARWLTDENAAKQVLEATFDINSFPTSNDDPQIKYLPGDSIGIYVPNSNDTIVQLLDRLKLDGDRIVTLNNKNDHELSKLISSITPCRIFDLFKWCVELSSLPKKGFLRMLAEYTSDEKQRNTLLLLSSISGKNEYKKEIEEKMPTLIEILQLFDTSNPPIDHLLSTLPPLQPRYYSHTKSPMNESTEARIAFSIVEYKNSENKLRIGLCSHYITNLALFGNFISPRHQFTTLQSNEIKSDDVIIFPKTSETFRFPLLQNTDDLQQRLIMIGPGTGVTPFISQLQYLLPLKKLKADAVGDIWLFYGCRNESLDYLYRSEIEEFERKKLITRLSVAFSRDNPDDLVYVQHKLLDNADDVYDWICNHNAKIYICGDAKGMTKGVNNSLLEIFQKIGKLSAKEAADQLSNMMTQKRICYDVWA